jgi:hypothetical protein
MPLLVTTFIVVTQCLLELTKRDRLPQSILPEYRWRAPVGVRLGQIDFSLGRTPTWLVLLFCDLHDGNEGAGRAYFRRLPALTAAHG